MCDDRSNTMSTIIAYSGLAALTVSHDYAHCCLKHFVIANTVACNPLKPNHEFNISAQYTEECSGGVSLYPPVSYVRNFETERHILRHVSGQAPAEATVSTRNLHTEHFTCSAQPPPNPYNYLSIFRLLSCLNMKASPDSSPMRQVPQLIISTRRYAKREQQPAMGLS